MTIKCSKGSMFALGFAAAIVVGYAVFKSLCKKTAEVRAARADKDRWENEGGPPRPPVDD